MIEKNVEPAEAVNDAEDDKACEKRRRDDRPACAPSVASPLAPRGIGPPSGARSRSVANIPSGSLLIGEMPLQVRSHRPPRLPGYCGLIRTRDLGCAETSIEITGRRLSVKQFFAPQRAPPGTAERAGHWHRCMPKRCASRVSDGQSNELPAGPPGRSQRPPLVKSQIACWQFSFHASGAPRVRPWRAALTHISNALPIAQAARNKPSCRSAVTPSSRPTSSAILPSWTRSTVVPVNRIFRPVAAGSDPIRKSLKAGPV